MAVCESIRSRVGTAALDADQQFPSNPPPLLDVTRKLKFSVPQSSRCRTSKRRNMVYLRRALRGENTEGDGTARKSNAATGNNRLTLSAATGANFQML